MSALALELLPGLRLANPIVAAAGTVGGGADFERLLAGRAARRGRRRADRPAAAGRRRPGAGRDAGRAALSGDGRAPGLETTLRVDLPRWRRWGIPTIGSLAGQGIDELVEVAEALATAGGLAALELDGGQPDERGRRLDETPERLAEVAAALRSAAAELPLIVKLWPDGADPRRAAEAVLAAGADALSLVNAPAGIVIDTRTRRRLGGARRGCAGRRFGRWRCGWCSSWRGRCRACR